MANGLGFNTYTARYMSKVVDAGGTMPTHVIQQAFEKLALDMFIHLRGLCAVWPIYGGTEDSHAFDLFCQYDIDSYPNGVLTHSSNGMAGNGTSTLAVVSTMLPATFLGGVKFSMGIYSRTLSNIDAYYDIGTFTTSNPMRFNCRNAAGNMLGYSGNNTLITGAVTNSQGLFWINRSLSTAASTIRNATLINTTAVAVSSLPNQNIGICGVTGDGTSGRQVALAFIGLNVLTTGGFSVTTFYNAVQAYQTSLGRQV